MEKRSVLIDENSTLTLAMEMLDKTSKKVLFVERDGKLAAALTDGDIRRWILKKGSLDAKVSDVANYNPIFLYEEESFKAKAVMREKLIEAIPIVDKYKVIKAIKLLLDEHEQFKKELSIPVVIMAGGLGTRLYPYTKILPKPLIPVGEKPIVEHIINRFNQHGVDEFFLVVNHKKNMIKAYFSEVARNYKVHYVDEIKPLGTGGGLSLIKDQIDSTFILTNCDILIEDNYEKIYSHHKKAENLITMVCSLKTIKIPYGVIETDKAGNLKEMKEKPEICVFVN